MQWIEFYEEKPTESGCYFVKGKKDMKAAIYYDAEADYWELLDLPANYFARDEMRWLKE